MRVARLKTGNANIDAAVCYIEKHLDQPLTLAEISQECGVSRYYFTKIFKKVMGQSFKEYHNRRRIEKAKNLLMEGPLRITEICYEVGYNDLSYFNRLFRRYVGMSPSSYRARPHGS